jgi:hypothetical protein
MYKYHQLLTTNGFEWLAKTMRKKVDLTETINDSEIMKNDFLTLWNTSHVKSFLNKFVYY